MAYSLDFRKMVILYINSGGSKLKASEIFGIHRQTIYNWLNREDLAPKLDYPKYRKLEKEDLKKYIKENPDAYLREIAQEFNVTVSGVSRAFARLKITNKKNSSLQRDKRRVKI